MPNMAIVEEESDNQEYDELWATYNPYTIVN
jgi:hypothetical protein